MINSTIIFKSGKQLPSDIRSSVKLLDVVLIDNFLGFALRAMVNDRQFIGGW